MTTIKIETIKNAIDKLNEEDLCNLIEHIAKSVWIPTFVPRERFEIPIDIYKTLIEDNNLNSKINDFVCYLLQNKFDNQDDDNSSSTPSLSDNDVVAEIELENDENMTVNGLLERMCTIAEVTET